MNHVERVTCPECNGKQRIVVSTGPSWSRSASRSRVCDRCRGFGTVAALPAPTPAQEQGGAS